MLLRKALNPPMEESSKKNNDDFSHSLVQRSDTIVQNKIEILHCEDNMRIQVKDSYRPPLPPIILSLSGCIPPGNTDEGP